MFSKMLNQDVTFWPLTGRDATGASVFGAPVAKKGRWEDRVQLITNNVGQEVVSKARAFFVDPIGMEGYLYLGSSVSADPRDVDGAKEIQTVTTVPDLRAVQQLVCAYM